MPTMTVGQLLINQELPEDLRDPNRTLDKRGINDLLSEVAKRYPERYREISHKLSELGWRSAQETGGFSFGIQHLRKSEASRKIGQKLNQQIQSILDDPRVADDKKDQKIIDTATDQLAPQQKAVYQEALAAGNPLAVAAKSGARGSPVNISSLLGSDLLYTDHRNKTIPIPITHSYSEGLSPSEYFSGAFGARRGVVDLKLSTAKAGYFSKQLAQVAHRLVVEDLDGPQPAEGDVKGMPVDTADTDNEGSLLAADVGPYKRNTLLSPAILRHLTQLKKDRILVRSPTVGGPAAGGVYSRDLGIRENGVLPGRGEFPGMAAAGALGEPLSQSQICLASYTRVRMADGKTKYIKDIRIGEMVLGADKNGNVFPVKVLNVYDNGFHPCYLTVFKKAFGDQLHLVSTLEHKLLGTVVSYGWNLRKKARRDIYPADRACPSGLLAKMVREKFYATVHDRLTRLTSHLDYKAVRQTDKGFLRTFDLEVDHPDHLFVLANGLITSNSSKHSGGIAGQSKAVNGFDYINALVNPPEHFEGGAAHSEEDGMVSRIADAPAGGKYVYINGREHHVPTGAKTLVKQGDEVEAGDVLSDGLPNMSKIVEHKGIGEGRRYFSETFRNTLRSIGLPAHRRNVELLSRGLINHVRLTGELGDYVPDDVVPYHSIEHSGYHPREGSEEKAPSSAAGKYLEKPAVHYSIGTKLRPSVIKTLNEFGVKNVTVHNDPPPFVPEMIRGVDSLQHDPDWQTKQYGFGLKGSLLKAVARGGTSDAAGTSFVPSLAGSVGFANTKGHKVRKPEPGWEVPETPVKSSDDLLYNDSFLD